MDGQIITNRKMFRNPKSVKAKVHKTKYKVERNPFTTMSTICVLIGTVWSITPSQNAHGFVDDSVSSHQQTQPILKNVGEHGGDSTVINFHHMGKNAKVGPLMGAYWGIHAVKGGKILPDEARVNWAENLKHLWAMKLAKDNVTPAAANSAQRIVSNYQSSIRDTKSIGSFVSEINNTSKTTQAQINYPALCIALKISNCADYHAVMGKIGGKELASYGMTEVLPAQNGHYNIVALDTTLRSAGENYINSIPALYDGLLSKGFYQFTSYAICRGSSCNGLGGVNFVDNYAGKHIPGSVLYVNAHNSHKAAFMFAAYNVGMLSRRLTTKEISIMKDRCPISEITEFVATAHHLPSVAINNATQWVKHGCNKPYRAYTGPALKEYAKKTAINYLALTNFLVNNQKDRT